MISSPSMEDGQSLLDRDIIQPIARNLRRRRLERGLSVSALARASGVSKSTVSELERGRGNPAIDTIWALSNALNLPFSALFESGEESEPIRVVRLSGARVIATDGEGFTTRHLLSRHGLDEFEVFVLDLDRDAIRQAKAHGVGVVEHTIVLKGSVEIGPVGKEIKAGLGDCVTFPGDVPHIYRAIGGPVRMISIHEYRTGT